MRIPGIIAALAATLLAIPSLAAVSEQDIRDNIALGALSFADNCARCHRIDGYGEEGLYPSLHSEQLLQDSALLIETILDGRTGHWGNDRERTGRLMPSLAFLSNAEIVAIIAFITNSWGGEVLLVSEQDVASVRDAMAGRAPQPPAD